MRKENWLLYVCPCGEQKEVLFQGYDDECRNYNLTTFCRSCRGFSHFTQDRLLTSAEVRKYNKLYPLKKAFDYIQTLPLEN